MSQLHTPSDGIAAGTQERGREFVLALLVGLSGWTTMLSWQALTDDFAEVGVPLAFAAILIGGGGAVARTARVPAWLLVLTQVLLVVPLSMLLSVGTLDMERWLAALSDGVESAQRYAAPVPINVPPVHALLIVGGVVLLVLLDVIGCTLRRVPVAGLVLLTAYSVPVTISGMDVPWWVFLAAGASFLGALYLQQGGQLHAWGAAASHGTQQQAFAVQTGAIRGPALLVGAASLALGLFVPLLLPTASLSLFEGNGPGKMEVEVIDPMVDLRRDLQRGEDIPLLRVTTTDADPSYLRIAVLARYRDGRWSPGDREIPDNQAATGILPALPGVSGSVPRKEFAYRVQVGDAFESTWLPTMAQSTYVDAGSDWRFDQTTRDFLSVSDDITTADITYEFRSDRLKYDADKMNLAVSGAADVASLFTEVPATVPGEVRRLAARVTADAPTRFQKAQVLQEWFRKDGGFTYDLRSVESVGDSGADLTDFLTNKVGYCEQFAASMALMARSLGIPARVAVGFLRPDQVGMNTYEFSAHDMHAWPELYFPGSGWVRFEPTPSTRASNVPDYTEADIAPVRTPSPTPSAARPSELDPTKGARPEQKEQATDQSADSGVPWVAVVVGLGLLALLGLVLMLPRLARGRQRARRLAPGSGIEGIWAELAATAADLGRAWPRGRSPRRTATAVGSWLAAPIPAGERPDQPRCGRDQAPQAAAALSRLTDALERSRYARSTPEEMHEAWLGDLDMVEESLRSGVSVKGERRAKWWPRSLRSRRPASTSETPSAETPVIETDPHHDRLIAGR